MGGTADRQFERLHREYGAALHRLALAYARQPADAEDLLQDIWLGVWRALPSFRGDCSERTFIYRIGHNRGLTFRSRRPPAPVDPALGLDVPDSREGPDVLAERSGRWRMLLDAVRALPESLRQVVVLHLEGLGNQEIAAVTGLSENNVAVRLSRARHRLRTLLQPIEEDR